MNHSLSEIKLLSMNCVCFAYIEYCYRFEWLSSLKTIQYLKQIIPLLLTDQSCTLFNIDLSWDRIFPSVKNLYIGTFQKIKFHLTFCEWTFSQTFWHFFFFFFCNLSEHLPLWVSKLTLVKLDIVLFTLKTGIIFLLVIQCFGQ